MIIRPLVIKEVPIQTLIYVIENLRKHYIPSKINDLNNMGISNQFVSLVTKFSLFMNPIIRAVLRLKV